MQKYVILGGGGSFAVHTALYLLSQGHEVIGVGRNSLRPPAFSLGIEDALNFRYRMFHVGNETDLLLEFLDVERPDVIVNFAAQGEGAISWRHSWRFFDINATQMARLVEELSGFGRVPLRTEPGEIGIEHLVRRDWLRRFVHIGSSEVYGSGEHAMSETDAGRPTSPYAASKLAFDHHLQSVHRVLGFPMNIVRPSNCYCPGQLLHRVVPKTTVLGLLGRRLPLQGGGRQRKSYLHAWDLARAVHLIWEHAPLGEVYNVGPDRPISIEYLVRAIAGVLSVPFEDLVTVTDGRPGEDACYWLSSAKIQKHLGWVPRRGLEAGLESVAAWAKEHLNFLASWPMTYELRA